MTDLQVIKDMLKRAKIKYEVENGGTAILVEGGYVGFVTQFDFNKKGELVGIGAYE
jgi:hypothetical protein